MSAPGLDELKLRSCLSPLCYTYQTCHSHLIHTPTFSSHPLLTSPFQSYTFSSCVALLFHWSHHHHYLWLGPHWMFPTHLTVLFFLSAIVPGAAVHAYQACCLDTASQLISSLVQLFKAVTSERWSHLSVFMWFSAAWVLWPTKTHDSNTTAAGASHTLHPYGDFKW